MLRQVYQLRLISGRDTLINGIKLMEADMRSLLFAVFIGLSIATGFFSPLSPVVTHAMADPR
jgi:hypothetical protein